MSTLASFPCVHGDDQIVTITLDAHPDSAQGSAQITPDALPALVQTLETLAARDDVQGLLLHARSPQWLPAPTAQAWLQLCRSGPASAIAQQLHDRSALLRRIEKLAKPVAMVLDAPCLDLQLECALACHYRVATDAPALRFGLPLVRRGVPPSAGATQRLPRLAGIPAALPQLLDGSLWDSARAHQLQLVSDVLPAAAALQAARQWLHAQLPGTQAPWDAKGYRIPEGAGAMAAHAMDSFATTVAGVRKATHDTQPAPLAILSSVYEGTQLPMDAALLIEAQCAALALAEPATANQLRSQWLHQDQARALVRRPAAVSAQPVRQLGVLGAGLMGAGIAQVAATAGIQVVLLDTSAAQAEAARAKIARTLERSHGAQAAQIVARITATADLQLLRGSDYIIEAIFEDRAAKAELMARVAQAMPERPAHFVWASNTSTLPITGLAAPWAQPTQVIGMHFFSPVPRMPLLEVITGAQTSQETLAYSLDLARELGKTPILVNDSPGFYTSRIFCAYIDEGMAMLAEGIAPALIENAARQVGFATSPLAVTDEVSLDLQALVIRQAQQDGLPERFLRTHAQSVVRRMNDLQRLGRKAGGGFYDYPAEGGKLLWPGLAQEFPPAPRQPDASEVASRLLTIEALESARCLAENVLTSAADGDLGALLGLGFPAWTGGTLSYIDTVGIADFVARCDQLADQHGERFRPCDWLRARAAQQQRFHA